MKKQLIFIVTAALAFSFTSCTEECEKNKTGDVTVTNNTNVDLWFDVTGDDGMTTENRMLKSGGNTTYTISAGTVKIWASFSSLNDDFQMVDTRSLGQCDNISYVTPSQTCALFQYTDITVKNETGYGLYFDVWIYDETHTDDGYYLGEVFIETGEQYTYANVAVGDGWANFEYYANDTWYMTDNDYEINACTPFTFTWTAEKSIETKESKRRANGITGTREREIKR